MTLIQNIIPDELVKTINPADFPITGANYVTLTTDLQVLPPSNQQLVNQSINLSQIAQDFESKVQAELAAQLLEFDPRVLMHNSPQSKLPYSPLPNSVSGVTQQFTVDSLWRDIINPPITQSVNAFLPASVISDANQPSSLSYLIDDALAKAQLNFFVDADNDDNLIEMRPEDAQQLGGLRAWQGNDKVIGTPNSDTANGNEGNDLIFGYEGDDLLLGGAGDDYLAGGKGRDVLVGEDGIDLLIGNADDDILIADGKGDFLIGSAGADEFILRSYTLTNDAADAHRILDFTPGNTPADVGDMIKIADFQGRNDISFARVDVNLDGNFDTAMLCPDGVVGVVMGIDPTNSQQLSSLTSSIFMVGPEDPTLTKISLFSGFSSAYTPVSTPASTSMGL